MAVTGPIGLAFGILHHDIQTRRRGPARKAEEMMFVSSDGVGERDPFSFLGGGGELGRRMRDFPIPGSPESSTA